MHTIFVGKSHGRDLQYVGHSQRRKYRLYRGQVNADMVLSVNVN
jgi:hypothetical protein